MRWAAALAASRRGSSTMIRPPPINGLIQKDKRHARGLARARRGDQNRPAPGGERAQEGGDRLVDGQGFVENHAC